MITTCRGRTTKAGGTVKGSRCYTGLIRIAVVVANAIKVIASESPYTSASTEI